MSCRPLIGRTFKGGASALWLFGEVKMYTGPPCFGEDVFSNAEEIDPFAENLVLPPHINSRLGFLG